MYVWFPYKTPYVSELQGGPCPERSEFTLSVIEGKGCPTIISIKTYH